MMDTTQKLQAFLAHAGLTSRRKAETLIAAGQITVNGQVAHLGQRVSPEDTIVYQGRVLTTLSENHYYLLNKPVGVVSTVSDELGRPTVLSLLPPAASQLRLYPVGRLDVDSQGLMLLTNDGEVAYHMTHPKFEITKSYEVTLDRAPTNLAIDHFTRGVKLTDGFAKPTQVVQQTPNRFLVTLSQGRNRQVRRMWSRVGYEVTTLCRVTLGPFSLPDLNSHTYRLLNPEEIAVLKAHLQVTNQTTSFAPQLDRPTP